MNLERTAVFVPARLKSKRLKNKALKMIGPKSSIQWCLYNSNKMNKVNKVMLLTSRLKQDDKLLKLKFNKKIKIFRGSANNLVKRFIEAAKKFKIDTVIRVTGDCPFVSKEILDYLLESHFKKNADFTAAKKHAVGTSGEIIQVNALKLLLKKIKNFKYSEYMTMFFLDNPNYFKINLVDLPKSYVRNYRLTLDYIQDLQMFNKLYLKSVESNKEINLKNIFFILDKFKNISKINKKKKLLYSSKNFRRKILKFTKIK